MQRRPPSSQTRRWRVCGRFWPGGRRLANRAPCVSRPHPAARVGRLPADLVGALDQQHRPADDRRRRRHPGLLDLALVLRGRDGRLLPAHPAHRLRAVRRHALRCPRPADARARHGGRADGLLGRAGRPVGGRRLERRVALRPGGRAVGVLRRRQPRTSIDHPSARRYRTAARGQRARHARLEHRLHGGAVARWGSHRCDRRGVGGLRR